VRYGNWAKFVHPSTGYGSRNSNFYQTPNSNPGCFKCGDLKHRVRNCPVLSAKHRRPEQQPSTPQQPDIKPRENQQSELFQIRRVLNRISDSVTAFRKEVEKKFAELERRIPKVDETDHADNLKRLPNCRRISRLSCRSDSENVKTLGTEQRPVVHGVEDAVTIVKSPTFKLNAVPSITTDLACIQEEEDLQESEDIELRTRSKAINAQTARSSGDREGVTRTPTTFENERLVENTSDRETEEAVRTTGEVHFGSEESADEPISRLKSGSRVDEERNPTGAELMETAELNVNSGRVRPLVDCQLDTMKDNLHQTTGSTSAMAT